MVYNHQSGDLGSMHTVNIYLNWAPRQERSDWLEHWATEGVKPVFFVEWGLPHISSWSSYRGPDFIWTTPALQQVWDSEFAAPYVGQSAYDMTSVKVKSMTHEEELWAGGKPFAWSNLNQYLSQQKENYREIQALFASDNWRSHRAWGISAMLPWDQEGLWEWRDNSRRKTAGPPTTTSNGRESYPTCCRPARNLSIVASPVNSPYRVGRGLLALEPTADRLYRRRARSFYGEGSQLRSRRDRRETIGDPERLAGQ